MTIRDKLIAKFKFKEDPEKLKFRDIEKILVSLGFEKIQTKGSHVKYKNQKFPNDVIVPIHSNECKPFYKRQIYKIIKYLL
ncbi:type II toxin-antitoxin system HicA family toxin [Candidatus Nomurabacteria bacterium]|nr:type II toxin-antitoxin system HicA family toxin [Candidatus Nomurabacteria bacterium]